MKSMAEGRMEEFHLLRAETAQIEKKHGINRKINFLNLMQAPFLMVNLSLINHISRTPEHPLYHALSTEGFLHIQNLCAQDPYYALPVIVAILNCLNIKFMKNLRYVDPKMEQQNATMSKLQYLPLISIPITVTFPAGFNLYMLIFASFQCV